MRHAAPALFAALCAFPACSRETARHAHDAATRADSAALVRTDAGIDLHRSNSESRPDAAHGAPPRAGTTLTLRPASAPFATHPEVLVRAPPSYDGTGPVNVVVFLHGWNGCVAVVAGGANAPCVPGGTPRFAMDVLAQFERAAVDALLVVPQLAFDAPSGAAGRLGEPGGLRALLAEILASPALSAALGGARALGDLGRVVIFAHSGAFAPAALAVDRGGVEVHEVHLLDAVYRDLPAIERWAQAHAGDFGAAGPSARRLTVVYTDRESTGPRSRALVSRLAATTRALAWNDASLAPPAPAAYERALFAQRTGVSHEDIPRVFLAAFLESAGLGSR